jgi:DNA (cytosine-5)-methyltransferase 1
MRYLSLFSGIEAASVAWKPLGWECVGVAEIEPFPCAVLKHHYPDVPNLGDITKVTQDQIEALGRIDLVVGGFPCQDLSVAGKRKGMTNADGSLTRSGLFFTAMHIIEWAKPRWVVVENVPGLFSSNKGRDFGSVVGELAGVEIGVPADGWQNSGVAVGPKGLVEWTVLDAQFVRVESRPRAVPQRRRRVFVVRDSGNWGNRPPLFLNSESLQRNTPPRREAGKGFTHSIASSIGASGRGFERAGETRGQDPIVAEVAPTVQQGPPFSRTSNDRVER